jgi:hypothetical protein
MEAKYFPGQKFQQESLSGLQKAPQPEPQVDERSSRSEEQRIDR